MSHFYDDFEVFQFRFNVPSKVTLRYLLRHVTLNLRVGYKELELFSSLYVIRPWFSSTKQLKVVLRPQSSIGYVLFTLYATD